MGRSRDLADGTLAELNVDSNTLVVDATNNRVGIGTTPTSDFHHYKNASAVVQRIQNQTSGMQFQMNDGVESGAGVIYMEGSGPLTLWTGGSQRMRIDSSGNLKFNSGYGSVATAYGCRAWVNFDGTGTVAIRASGNVSSITDNAVGDYTVNFTNAFVDSNYNFITNSSNTNNSNILCIGQLNWDNPTKTTSALRLYNLKSNNGTLTDQNTISVAVFR